LSTRVQFWTSVPCLLASRVCISLYLLVFYLSLFASSAPCILRAPRSSLSAASSLRSARARNRERRLLRAAETALTALERINISSRRVQPFFRRAYRWGGRLLFTPVALVVCVLLAVAGFAAAAKLWRDADVAAGFGANPLLAIITVKLLFILTLAAHQIVHGLALVHYGRRVREFGFTFLHGFLPTFYVDVTDIFMASRR